MRVLVCGTRVWSEPLATLVHETLDRGHRIRPVSAIIEGDAPGADTAAAIWAQETPGVEHLTFPANWSRGRRGGPERNARMLVEGRPDVVLAFHTDPGLGKGTADMVRKARAAGIPVRVFLLGAGVAGTPAHP